MNIWNLSAHNAILFKNGRGKSDPELRDRLIEGIIAQLSKIASDPIAFNVINAAPFEIKVCTSSFQETISILSVAYASIDELRPPAPVSPIMALVASVPNKV